MFPSYLVELVGRALQAWASHPIALVLNWIAVTITPSKDELWDALRRLAIFVPIIIYLEYKQYMLKKKLYRQLLIVAYQRRRTEYLDRQREKKSNNDSLKQKTVRSQFQYGGKCGIASAVGTNKLQRIGTNDKTVQTGFDLTEFLAKEICSWKPFGSMISDVVPTSQAKKLKAVDRIIPTVEPIDRTTVGMLRGATGMASLQTVVVQYFEVVTRGGAGAHANNALPYYVPKKLEKELQGVKRARSRLESSTKAPSAIARARAEARKARANLVQDSLSEAERRWLRALERGDRMRKERMATLRESEMQKALKKEKERKLALVRRRATIAKIKDQNQRILMGRGKPQSNEVDFRRMINVRKSPLLPIFSYEKPTTAPTQNTSPRTKNAIGEIYSTPTVTRFFAIRPTGLVAGNILYTQARITAENGSRTSETELSPEVQVSASRQGLNTPETRTDLLEPTASNDLSTSTDHVKTIANEFEKLGEPEVTNRPESKDTQEEQVGGCIPGPGNLVDTPDDGAERRRITIKTGRRRLKKNNETQQSCTTNIAPAPTEELDSKDSLFQLKVVQRTDERLKAFQCSDKAKNGPGGDHFSNNTDDQRDEAQPLPFEQLLAEPKFANHNVGGSCTRIVMSCAPVATDSSKSGETLKNRFARNRERMKKVGRRSVAKQLALLSDRKSLSPLRRRNANPDVGGAQDRARNPLSKSTPVNTINTTGPLVSNDPFSIDCGKSSSLDRWKTAFKNSKETDDVSHDTDEVSTDVIQNKNRPKWNATAFMRARFIEQGRQSKDAESQGLPSPSFPSRSRSNSLEKSNSSPPTPR